MYGADYSKLNWPYGKLYSNNMPQKTRRWKFAESRKLPTLLVSKTMFHHHMSEKDITRAHLGIQITNYYRRITFGKPLLDLIELFTLNIFVFCIVNFADRKHCITIEELQAKHRKQNKGRYMGPHVVERRVKIDHPMCRHLFVLDTLLVVPLCFQPYPPFTSSFK